MPGLEELSSDQNSNFNNLDGGYYRLVDDTESLHGSRTAIYNATTDVRKDNNAYREQFRKKRDPNIYATFSNSVKSQNNIERKPLSMSAEVRLPPIERKLKQTGSEVYDLDDDRAVSIGSEESLKLNKNIVKWNFWWDKVESNIKVHNENIPDYSKKTLPKVGSLENYTYRPGGGNIKVVNQKPVWKKEPRTDHIMHDYQRSGGNIRIVDEKPRYSSNAKVHSLDNMTYRPGGGNVQILDQPLAKKAVKPRIDTGFVYQVVQVSGDYPVRPVVRKPKIIQSDRDVRSPYTGVKRHKFRDID